MKTLIYFLVIKLFNFLNIHPLIFIQILRLYRLKISVIANLLTLNYTLHRKETNININIMTAPVIIKFNKLVDAFSFTICPNKLTTKRKTIKYLLQHEEHTMSVVTYDKRRKFIWNRFPFCVYLLFALCQIKANLEMIFIRETDNIFLLRLQRDIFYGDKRDKFIVISARLENWIGKFL